MATAAFFITMSLGPGFGIGAAPTVSGFSPAELIQAA